MVLTLFFLVFPPPPPTLPAYHFRIIVLLLLLHINNKPKNQLQPCEHTEEAGASLSF